MVELNESFFDMQLESHYQGRDLSTWLVELANRRGAHPFLIWAPFEGESRTYSYADLLESAQRIAGGLWELGVRPGDRVLVHTENCPEAIFVRFACAWLGAVCVATNAVAAGPELAFFAESSRARYAVTQSRFATVILKHCPTLHKVAIAANHNEAVEAPFADRRAIRFADLIGDPLPQRQPTPFDSASVMYTTGSTSRPKGVVWTHANMLWAAELNARQQNLCAEDVHLLFLPIYHVLGLSWCLLSTMWAGATVVLQQKFSRSGFWPAALAYGATVGSHVLFTIAALKAEQVPQNTFRLWLAARHDHTHAVHFGVPLMAGWGMTEMLAQVTASSPAPGAATGGIGQPSSAYAVRVVDEDNRQVDPGGTGHLLVGGVRGISIFQEYDNDPRTTAESFDADGFFRTGDRVRLNPGGWLEFTDRIKDIVKVRGENVSASEVESIIIQVDGVKEVAVVGMPSPLDGEVVVAFVGMRPDLLGHIDSAVLADSIKAHCARHLAPFKVPGEVRFLDALPRIGIGKVAKATLRQWLGTAPGADNSTSISSPQQVRTS